MQLSTAKFSGHESFPFRNTWLTKGVRNCAEDHALFRKDEALVTLGVGKNMVRAIKYWCLATQVLEVDPEISNNRGYYLRPTPIGKRVFLGDRAWDPYLEDEGTVWLLHCLLATNPDWATTTYYAFNELTGLQFSRASLREDIARVASAIPRLRWSESTIKRDVNVFVRMYSGSVQHTRRVPLEDTMDCPLAELGLLYQEPIAQTYAFARGPKDSLPDAVVFYAMCIFAENAGGRRSFTFDELAYKPLGPGRVFKLDEVALAERLEHLEALTEGGWRLTETAGYRQVLVTRSVDPLEALDRYYQHRFGDTAIE